MPGHNIPNDHQYKVGFLISDGANAKFSLSDIHSLYPKEPTPDVSRLRSYSRKNAEPRKL